VTWSGPSETDLYPYIKDFFVHVLRYPKEKIKLDTTENNKIPDLQLVAKETNPSFGAYWVVAEIKPNAGLFRNPSKRNKVWQEQLQHYVNPETVYALLMDPTTVVQYLPDGTIFGDIIDLQKLSVEEVQRFTCRRFTQTILHRDYQARQGRR
jgi:hypothetical protein